VGDPITIDGSTGEVFEGSIAAAGKVVPEAQTLLAWARELGIEPGSGPFAAAASAPEAVPSAKAVSAPEAASAPEPRTRPVTPERCLRVIALKGFAQQQAIADALLTTPEGLQPALDALVADGSATTVAGAYRLTDDGTARAVAALEAERDAWGTDRANAALEGFLDLDGRMKAIVTAWQLRDPETQVINDHADPQYDRDVLDRLAALHADATAWLTPLEPENPLLADYRVRLDHALEQAVAGDGRFVASPRVDSYHGAWFELHEELIQLAGRTRADEVAAGRA
jgi:pyruvate,orthophosphate dikinase